MKIYNLNELSRSRIWYDKNPPKFMLYLILTVLLFLVIIIIGANFTYKTEVVRSSGILQAENKSYIMSSVGGKIKNVYFDNNEYVYKDDILFELDAISVEAQIAAINAKIDYLNDYIAKLDLAIESLLAINVEDISNLVNPFITGENYLKYKSIISAIENVETEAVPLENVYESRLQIVEGYLSQYYQTKGQYTYELVGSVGQRSAYELTLDSYIIRASNDGYVMFNLNLHPGMVIGNDVLGYISDSITNDNCLMECYVDVSNRYFIKNGDIVEIVMAGLSQSKYGYLSGSITDVSSDIVINDEKPYYKVTVRINNITMEDVVLTNGQAGEVRIKYDSVTWMNWVLAKAGIIDR